MKYKYGSLTPKEVGSIKTTLQKKIYFLLLVAEDKSGKFSHIKLNEAFESLMHEMNGISELLQRPIEIVHSMKWLEIARMEIEKKEPDFKVYRKSILDAENEIKKISEEG